MRVGNMMQNRHNVINVFKVGNAPRGSCGRTRTRESQNDCLLSKDDQLTNYSAPRTGTGTGTGTTRSSVSGI